MALTADPLYGRGTHQLIDAQTALEDQLEKRVRDALKSPTYRPPVLPRVAMELVAATAKVDTSAKKVIELLTSDPLLAAQVLRTAQSAIYGSAPIHTLDDAVRRLGTRRLSDLAMETAMTSRIFRGGPYSEAADDVARHARLTGHIARLVCRYTGLPGEYAFLEGLMHDVGAILVMFAIGDIRTERPPIERAWRAINALHEEAGALACRAWKLPEEIALVVGHHHSLEVGGKTDRMRSAIMIADAIADDLDAAAPSRLLPGLQRQTNRDVHAARVALSINADQWKLLLRDAAALANDLSSSSR